MTPSWDLFIILFFVIMGIYGFLLGRGRVLNILIDCYVGLAVSTAVGGFAFEYLSKITEISHSFNVTMFGAKVFVFVAVVFILIMNKELSGSSDDTLSSSIYTGIYGVLTAGLILYSVFSFMGDIQRVDLFTSSSLAVQVYRYQIVWLVAPIAVVLVSTILNRKSSKK